MGELSSLLQFVEVIQSSHYFHLSSLVGVLLASKRCDRQQLEVGLPALQQALSVASQGLAACTAVQQTLQEW